MLSRASQTLSKLSPIAAKLLEKAIALSRHGGVLRRSRLRFLLARVKHVDRLRRREYRDHRLDWMIKSGGIEVVLAGLEAGNIRLP